MRFLTGRCRTPTELGTWSRASSFHGEEAELPAHWNKQDPLVLRQFKVGVRTRILALLAFRTPSGPSPSESDQHGAASAELWTEHLTCYCRPLYPATKTEGFADGADDRPLTHLKHSIAAEQIRTVPCLCGAVLTVCSLQQYRRRPQWLVKGIMRHRGDISVL
ncbi:hypothetical protein HBI56_087300 [Parastagonospora nodorum]|nr:hypothetical protein HBI06_144830 [Parastagonospora nodorum]KAH4232190.1 hypothetical protein HBI05_175390 [Parastagonospora nodorum]KAH5058667.1 hypothetical protein HBH96_093420 [Parastagonospora nodorum]KAH6519671.1 hypothetical protein HBI56_087300 [Parastagonospora nodorum]